MSKRKFLLNFMLLILIFSSTVRAYTLYDHSGTSLYNIKIGTAAIHKRVSQYNRLFAEAGARYGVDPNILAAICMQESAGVNYSYRADGTSYPAWGIMQIEYVLVPDFINFGLETTGVKWKSEDRLVPEKAIMYAAHLISESLYHYDMDYAKTIQSYNFGQTVLDRIIKAKGDNWMSERVNAKKYADNWKYEKYGDAKYIENVLRYYHKNIVYVGAKVRIDGKLINFSSQYPVLWNDRTLVPVREVTEAIGAKVEWIEETQTARISKGNTTIKLPVDSDIAYINGEKVQLDTETELINKKTMIPVRFVSENFGMNVLWDDSTRTVHLSEIA